MFTDIVFSLASDTKIGEFTLLSGTYKLMNRSGIWVIWDSFNLYTTTIPDKSVFDELVSKNFVKITEEIHPRKYTLSKDQDFEAPIGQGWHAALEKHLAKNDSTIHVIEQDDEQYYLIELNDCKDKSYINELIENGILVPAIAN
jgi:hypothetical protein